MTPESVKLKELQAQNFGHVLFECSRFLDEIAQRKVNEEAGSQVARPAMMRLLPHLDFDGISPSELALKVDISKQAVGKLLEQMQQLGMVEFVKNPHDGRSFKVRLTAMGGTAYRHGLGVLTKLEKKLKTQLGDKRVNALFSELSVLHETLSEWHRTEDRSGKKGK